MLYLQSFAIEYWWHSVCLLCKCVLSVNVLFVITDSVLNLREENKQLRKAHHDVHTQLQDAQVRTYPVYLFVFFVINMSQLKDLLYTICLQLKPLCHSLKWEYTGAKTNLTLNVVF